jgi:flavin-dependent dehydrogenase
VWRTDLGVEAPMLVGAGGHFCPVARCLAGPAGRTATVVAVEGEARLRAPDACPVSAEVPELYFCRDLRGYGWCVRKHDYLNVGFGRVGDHEVAGDARAFFAGLRLAGRVPAEFPDRWTGHAYRLRVRPTPRLVDDGVLLVGDAAGLATAASGEGILPAVVSGALAAQVIAASAPRFTQSHLAAYEAGLAERLGEPAANAWAGGPSAHARAWVGCQLLALPWFARHVLVPRWFLHLEGDCRRADGERSSSVA